MLKIANLNVGFSDAENYKRRENKDLLNQIFIKDRNLDKLYDSSISFLVGDKGTGKTAYAIYASNTEYNQTVGTLKYLRETEYQKFVTLKQENKLDLSDYSAIWRVIIYLLLAETVHEREGEQEYFKRFSKLRYLREAINEFYVHAFSPEILQALKFVQESKFAAELISKHAKLSGETIEQHTFNESRFQTNLMYIQKNLENALRSLELKKSYILFIDGIDIRPNSIEYQNYNECIKGLANAVWEVNNDFFSSIKGSKGRLKVVLLVRPDIFCALGLQNQNTKIRDNSVLLDWTTTYKDHRHSGLFSIASTLLQNCQDDSKTMTAEEVWDNYFPYDSPNVLETFDHPTAFIGFLRHSLCRPRDIVTMLSMLQDRVVQKHGEEVTSFTLADFSDPSFRRDFAQFLMGEVKDYLSFYYSEADYEDFVGFFVHMKGSNKFDYDIYLQAYEAHIAEIISKNKKPPKFMEKPELFLQFLYELNIVSYIEIGEFGEKFFHYCFKERTYSNIAPKIKLYQQYEFFYGISKAINTGRKLR